MVVCLLPIPTFTDLGNLKFQIFLGSTLKVLFTLHSYCRFFSNSLPNSFILFVYHMYESVIQSTHIVFE